MTNVSKGNDKLIKKLAGEPSEKKKKVREPYENLPRMEETSFGKIMPLRIDLKTYPSLEIW